MVTPRKITENFIATEVDDEVVLIDMAGGELYSLKGTGRAVWNAIDGETSLELIASRMTDQFEVSEGDALTDVQGLLTELSAAKLLEV